MLRRPALVVWCLFLLFTPLYIFPSGLPQPGDLLVIALFPLSLMSWNGRLDPQNARMLRALVRFTLWVFAVNYGWALLLGRFSRIDFAIHPFFYAFNTGVVFSALVLARRDRLAFLHATVNVVLVTVFVQVVASFYFGTDMYRGELFFNSPNQLGYYALLSACLFSMSQKPLGHSRLRTASAITGCAYLALLTASRAALSGIVVLLVVLIFSNPRTIILASLAAVGLLGIGGPVADAIDHSQSRVVNDRHANINFAEERGYDRIVNYPQYLPLGAGEGAYERYFAEGEAPRELHSTFGAVLFSYGIVGIVLFLLFAVEVIRGAPLSLSLFLIPAFVFTVAHQGLRFTMFWVVLAAFVVLKTMPRDAKGNLRVAAPDT